MRIGYFTSDLPYRNPQTGEITRPFHAGGVGNAAFNLAVQMTRLGHEVTVFTSSHDGQGSVEVHGSLRIVRYRRHFTVGEAPISLSLLLKPLVGDGVFDVVHGHMGNLPAPLTAALHARIHGVPLLTTYHNDYIGGFGSLGRRMGVYLYNAAICRRILAQSSRIVALSEHHATTSPHLLPHRQRITVIPNGINLEDFTVDATKEEARRACGLPPDARVILYVGSLSTLKAPDVLLRAMSHVRSVVPDAFLAMVGNGELRDRLKGMVDKAGLDSSVQLPGFVDGTKKSLYYRAADVFVLPSISETFPIVLLEASAARLPLIVSSLDCFRPIVEDGVNGLYTKTRDDEALANAIAVLLMDEGLRQRMGSNARSRVEALTWAEIARRIEGIYRELT